MQPDPREERGRQLAKRGSIRQVGRKWKVPSQTQSDSTGYVVDIEESRCTCPDFEVRKGTCKHMHAVLFWIAWGLDVASDGTVTETVAVKRKTYPQNWPAYNTAQVYEKEYVAKLLKALCDGVDPLPRKSKRGQPPLPIGDAIRSIVMKVYTTFSGRRAQTDLRDLARVGLISKVGCYNSGFNYMQAPSTTAILTRLIEESAAPLSVIEQGQFAIDSTGFSTVSYDRWFDQKHGKLRAEHPWVKLHVFVGTMTNVVAAVRVSGEADCPVLPDLLTKARERFQVQEVSGDKAYASKDNLKAIYAAGANPFLMFKDNAVMSMKSPEWSRALGMFLMNRDAWLPKYHRRSNVEATMWAIKSKFGGRVASKLPTAQVNEVLCKVLCHNLCCLVQAIFEHGVQANFWPVAPAPATALTLVEP